MSYTLQHLPASTVLSLPCWVRTKNILGEVASPPDLQRLGDLDVGHPWGRPSQAEGQAQASVHRKGFGLPCWGTSDLRCTTTPGWALHGHPWIAGNSSEIVVLIVIRVNECVCC